MNRLVVMSGCSGGGKSTLLAELQRRGHAVVEEPGRRIILEEQRLGGRAVPWIDMAAFLRRAIEVALRDRALVRFNSGWTFFDRGLIDAAAALEALSGEPLLDELGQRHRYHACVFLAPPWPAIYRQDAERRHDFEAALTEYERLRHVYPALGYEICVLPECSVAERADFVLEHLAGVSMS